MVYHSLSSEATAAIGNWGWGHSFHFSYEIGVLVQFMDCIPEVDTLENLVGGGIDVVFW